MRRKKCYIMSKRKEKRKGKSLINWQWGKDSKPTTYQKQQNIYIYIYIYIYSLMDPKKQEKDFLFFLIVDVAANG